MFQKRSEVNQDGQEGIHAEWKWTRRGARKSTPEKEKVLDTVALTSRRWPQVQIRIIYEEERGFILGALVQARLATGAHIAIIQSGNDALLRPRKGGEPTNRIRNE